MRNAPDATLVRDGAVREGREAMRAMRGGIRGEVRRCANGELSSASCLMEDECRWKDYMIGVENCPMRVD